VSGKSPSLLKLDCRILLSRLIHDYLGWAVAIKFDPTDEAEQIFLMKEARTLNYGFGLVSLTRIQINQVYFSWMGKVRALQLRDSGAEQLRFEGIIDKQNQVSLRKNILPNIRANELYILAFLFIPRIVPQILKGLLMQFLGKFYADDFLETKMRG
jgi:hypothetical protein